MNLAIFLRNVDEIWPEIHRNVQEMTNCLEILRKSARKIRKMLKISGICAKFSFFISFDSSLSCCSAGCESSSTQLDNDANHPAALKSVGDNLEDSL